MAFNIIKHWARWLCAIIKYTKRKDFYMSIDSPLIYKHLLRNEGEDAANEFM
jgi:hypothetical protein